MAVRVNIPIRLEVGVDLLRVAASAEIATQVAAAVKQALEFMRAQVAADGHHGDAVFHEPTLHWSGAGLGALPASERAVTGARLLEAVKATCSGFAASSAHAPGAVKSPSGDWQIERLEFMTGFGEILALLDEFPWNHPADLRMRFSDQWSDQVHGVAWVVTVQRPVSWSRVHGAINAERQRDFEDDSLFGYFWDRTRTENLRNLDRKRLHALPSLAHEPMTAPRSASGTALWQLPVGTRMIFVAAKLPAVVLETYLEVGRAFTVQVQLDDALTATDGVIDVERLRHLYSLDDQDLLGLVQCYAEVELGVWVLPFAVKKSINGETLRASLLDHAYPQHARAGQLGQLRPLGTGARTALPDAVTAPILALPHDETVVPDRVSPDASWQPGWIGAYLCPLIDDDELRHRVAYARKWPGFDADALHVIELLNRSNGILSADRYKAIWAWTAEWQNTRPEAFDLLLYAVDRRGALGRLFDAWLEEKLYPSRLRTLISLCLRSRYARHPKVLKIIETIERWDPQHLKHTYDVDAQQIRLFHAEDAGRRITAAGSSTDPAAGVVAETRSYYSKEAKIKKLNKEALAQLAVPVKSKLGELMTHMVCGGNDSMTADDLMAQATRAALKDVKFADSDYEPTTLRLSLRVLRLERKPNAGVTDVLIHWVPVQQFAGEAWTRSGKVVVGSALQFEAALTEFHVDHLMNWVVTPIAITGAIFLTGGAALAGGATVGGLVVAILFSELLYVFTNWREGLTLNGFLMAAWMGEIELLGFMGVSRVLGLAGEIGLDVASKLFTRVALRLGAEVGAEALTVKLLRMQATKWILFLLHGGVVGVEAGAAAVLGLVAQDLLQMTTCNSWSSPEEYWDRFKTGLIIGAALELVAAPLLAPILRPVLAKASTMLEAVQALRKSGKSFAEITRVLLRGSDEMEQALVRALPRASVVQPMARAYQQKIREVLKVYVREYETRAYRNLIALLDDELNARASRTLSRLLEQTSEQEVDLLLARIAAGKQISVAEMLDLLGGLEGAELQALLQRGGIARLAESPALLALLRRSPHRGWHFLAKVFGRAVGDCEAYVARFANAPPEHLDQAMELLLQHNNTLGRDAVADAILRYGRLTPHQIRGLKWIQELESQLDAAARRRFTDLARTKSPYELMEQFHGDFDAANVHLDNQARAQPPDTIERFVVGEIPRLGQARVDYLANPSHWPAERAALHDRLLENAKAHARAFAEQLTGQEPTLYAMRGNTAAGKTRAVSGNVEELAGPMKATTNPAVNPDNFKSELIKATPGATSQDVHWESSMLASRLEKELLGMRMSDGKPASMLIDKRLPTVNDVRGYAKVARESGRKFVLFDVDAPLEDSLAGVLERVPGDKDPLPPFKAVADGFEAVRRNREAVLDLFKDPNFGEYHLYATKPNGDRIEIATTKNGNSWVNDAHQELFRIALKLPEESLATVRITRESIDAVIRNLPPERAARVRGILEPYEGWTWKAALDAHSRKKPPQ